MSMEMVAQKISNEELNVFFSPLVQIPEFKSLT